MTKLMLCVGVAVVLLSGSSRMALAADRTVTVAGTCTRQVAPDRGVIVLTAEYIEKELQSAIRKATQAQERVREDVRKLNLAGLELRTAEYSVGEAREWQKDRNVSRGYRARMGLEVATSDIQRLGEVMVIGARHGLQDVGRLSMSLSPQKALEEQTACLQAAAENARQKAEKLARSLGASLGEVVTLVEGGAPQPLPQPPHSRMDGLSFAKVAEMPAPTVEAGQQEISLTLQAVFALK